MSDNRLKSLAERIERLMDERDGIQSDIRDIYAEAKSAGYVPKVLRKAITRKRMDPDKRSEEDTILDLYEDALSPSMRRAVEMAKAGATLREIETETGIDHNTVARSVSQNKKSETGEVEHSGEAAGHPSEPSSSAEQSVNSGPLLGRVSPCSQHGQGEHPGTHSDEAPATPSVGAVESPKGERVASFILPSKSAWQAVIACREACIAVVEAKKEARRLEREQENARASKLAMLTDDDMPEPLEFLKGPALRSMAGAR